MCHQVQFVAGAGLQPGADRRDGVLTRSQGQQALTDQGLLQVGAMLQIARQHRYAVAGGGRSWRWHVKSQAIESHQRGCGDGQLRNNGIHDHDRRPAAQYEQHIPPKPIAATEFCLYGKAIFV